MTDEAMIHIGVTVLGWVALVATMRSQLSGLTERVGKLEAKGDKMPQDYVPRPEVKAQLDAIQKSVDETKGLLQVAVYGGRQVSAIIHNEGR